MGDSCDGLAGQLMHREAKYWLSARGYSVLHLRVALALVQRIGGYHTEKGQGALEGLVIFTSRV